MRRVILLVAACACGSIAVFQRRDAAEFLLTMSTTSPQPPPPPPDHLSPSRQKANLMNQLIDW